MLDATLRCSLYALIACSVVACSSSADEESSSTHFAGGAPSASDIAGGTEGSGVSAGQLTAADWDDNLNFEFFQAFLSKNVGGLNSADRVSIRVTNDASEPVSNARVVVTCDGKTALVAPTTTAGVLLFFPKHDGCEGASSFQVTASPAEGLAGAQATLNNPEGTDWNLAIEGAQRALPSSLDLAFVVDTTGSMGDEISYLSAEMQSIAAAVAKASSQELTLRYGLVVYRDEGDEYVTRTYDFTPNLADFQSTLKQVRADGGGDYEEALDRALQEMNKLSWNRGNAARVAFQISDAPPHPQLEASYLAQADLARRSGIKLIPVAASGVAERAEFLFRSAAQWTLSRYVFVTDDSGIGGKHQEPSIPCYQVQHLNRLMTRLVSAEVLGQYIAPDPTDIVRSAGNPSEGVCSLEGSSLRLY